MNALNRSLTRLSLCLLASTVLAVGSVVARGATPDYSGWDQVLLQNVRQGYVDYDGIRADPRFDAFITALGQEREPFAGRDDELAYLINAYNAFAIRGILDGYAPDTKLGRHRYFKRLKFQLDGESITLDALEQRRLRALGDARTHFAIVCPSLSCPRLANRAYLPETIDAQLDQAASGFVNDLTRNYFDVAQRTAFLSPLFDAFGADFEQSAGTVPDFLARYIEDPAARAALLEGRLGLRYLPYEWDLNGSLATE
jgi:hypothetical protein